MYALLHGTGEESEGDYLTIRRIDEANRVLMWW